MGNLRSKFCYSTLIACFFISAQAHSLVITLGVEDTFDLSNGAEVMTRSTGFDTYLNSLGTPDVANTFDDLRVNILRGFTFDLSALEADILSAELSFLLRPQDNNRGEGNDTIKLSGYDSSGTRMFAESTIGLGVDAGPNNYFPFDWQIDGGTGPWGKLPSDPANGFLVTFDLGNFAAQQGTGIDNINFLNQFGMLDVMIQDDTTVDYARLELTLEESSVPLPGTIWLLGLGLYGLAIGRRRHN